MSEDVTEKIRNLLIQLMQKKSISTSQMAKEIGMDRKKLKRILGGREIMSVDILLQISESLDLKPEDLAGIEEMSNSESNTLYHSEGNKGKKNIVQQGRKELSWEHNQARALIEIGFEQALFFTFLAHADQLKDSGLPDYILQKFSRHVPIQLDPLYHMHNKPEFQKKGLLLTLSFDALYTCFFPWESIVQVVFQPTPATIDQGQDSEFERRDSERRIHEIDNEIGDEIESAPKKSHIEEPSKKVLSSFAVISNDEFEEDSQEDVELGPKKPMFTLVEDDDI